jgi:hypothetical protein
MKTPDGVKIYLDIRGTTYLREGTALPATPEAALEMAGLHALTDRTFTVEGSDFVPVNEYQRLKLPAISILAFTNGTFPDYARLPLTVVQQEEAILRHLSMLERRKKKQTSDDGNVLDTALAVGTDMAPIIGEIKDAYRAITGRDPDTGESLRWWERLLSGLFAIPFLGKFAKIIGKGVKWLVRGGRFLGNKVGDLTRWIIGKWRKRKKRLGSGGQRSRKLASKTGTVWDRITPSGPMRPATAIPQYFELQTAGGKFFVNSNGTKHMAELVVGGDAAAKISHSVQMRSQVVLDSFARAVDEAETLGIRYGEIMNVGGWELIIEQTGRGGPLPVVKHALRR